MGTNNKKGLLWREVDLDELFSHLYLPQKARPPSGTCQAVEADWRFTSHTPASTRTMPATSVNPICSPRRSADKTSAETGTKLTKTPARDGPMPCTPQSQACCPSAVANTIRQPITSQSPSSTEPGPTVRAF